MKRGNIAKEAPAPPNTLPKKWPANAIVSRSLSGLIPYARNARTHTAAQIKQIVESMREWGWTNPILIDENSKIIAGHARCLAAAELGFEEVPCIVAEGWTVAQKKAYVIADNKLAMNAGWDLDLLGTEFAELQGMDFSLDLTGFPEGEISTLIAVAGGAGLDEDEIPEPAEQVICCMGDVWLLGAHRLVCGDATSQAQVETLMAGEKAALLLTDPPYGKLKIFHKDGSVGKANVASLKKYGAYEGEGNFSIEPVLKASAGFYGKAVIWGGNYFADVLPITTGWLCWDKTAGEHCWFSDFELAWTDLGIPAKIFHHAWQGMIRAGEKEDRVHPTQKPIALMEWILTEWTKAGATILDLFGGSGSTLIACERLGRRCYMMEIAPRYCDVIIRRWQKFTGKTATKESDGTPFPESG